MLIYVNPESESVPSGAVTTTLPEEPAPTTAFIVNELTTVKDAAGTPPKLTAVAPVKLLPTIVTFSPLKADCGLNEEIAVRPDLFLKTEILSEIKFVVISSGLLS